MSNIECSVSYNVDMINCCIFRYFSLGANCYLTYNVTNPVFLDFLQQTQNYFTQSMSSMDTCKNIKYHTRNCVIESNAR